MIKHKKVLRIEENVKKKDFLRIYPLPYSRQ